VRGVDSIDQDGGSEREAHSVLEDEKCTTRKKAEVGYLEVSRFGKRWLNN
jgi:hypothetical protein